MNARLVETMAADPQIRTLRRSEQDVWCYLAWQADDDGVVRRYIATRHLAGKTGYSRETVRKAVHRLEKVGLLRVSPGAGRTCSLYAVPATLSTMILEPQAPGLGQVPRQSGRPVGAQRDLAEPVLLGSAGAPPRRTAARSWSAVGRFPLLDKDLSSEVAE